MTSTLVVIIGQGGYNDMGLIRSCGEAGMSVILVCPEDIVMPLYKSKYVIKWFKEMITTTAQLESLITKLQKEYDSKIVLYPASDLAACVMDKYSTCAPEGIVVPNARGNLSNLMDKSIMGNYALNNELTVPKSVKKNLYEVDDKPPFLPCIIKPLKSIAGDKGDITICRDEKTYKTAVEIYKSKRFYNVLIQELIEGENQEEIAITGVSIGGGIVLTSGVIHKIRIRGNGSTVYAKFNPEIDGDLQNKIKKFIISTNYTGIFDIEFLKNNKGYFFIECNFRNGAYGYALTRAGFNMPYLFAIGSLHQPLPKYKVKKLTFMEERSDFLNVLEHNISLTQWIKDISQTKTLLWWNKKDPKPIIYHYKKKLISKILVLMKIK